MGQPWGGDEQGQKFAQKYNPNRDQIEKSAGILVQGLSSIHDAISDMADGHIDNDEAVKGIFTRIDPDAKGSDSGQGKG